MRRIKPELLKLKDKEFVDEYMSSKNQTRAAMKVFDIPPEKSKYAAVRAVKILDKPAVRKYLEDNAGGAAARIVKLSCRSHNDMVKLAANKDILDRAGFKPEEAGININMPLYLPPELLQKYNLDKQFDNPLLENNGQTNTSTEGNNS